MKRWCAWVLVLLGGAATAYGQEPLADWCAEIPDGEFIRVLARDGTVSEGAFGGCRLDDLRLLADGEIHVFPAEEIQAVWLRERKAGSGAKTGALIGAGGGGALFGLMAVALRDIGEGDGDDISIAGAAVIGAGLGAAAGAASGAIVGAAVSGWRLIGAREGAPPAMERAAPEPEPATRIGSLFLGAGGGWAGGVSGAAAGGGFVTALTADHPSGFSLGFEFGLYDVGPQPRDPLPFDSTYVADDRVWFVGAVSRYEIGSALLRPYGALGVAGYNWEDGFAGINYGAGVLAPLRGRRLTARVEYRRHVNIQRLTGADPRFSTLTAGVALGW